MKTEAIQFNRLLKTDPYFLKKKGRKARKAKKKAEKEAKKQGVAPASTTEESVVTPVQEDKAIRIVSRKKANKVPNPPRFHMLKGGKR